MSEFEIELTMPEEFAKPAPFAMELQHSEDFNRFIEELVKQSHDGAPLTHVLANAVMVLFQPGFVVIGSPIMEASEDGTLVPESIGLALSNVTDLTPSNLATVLSVLAEGIANSVNMTFEPLKEDEDSDSE